MSDPVRLERDGEIGILTLSKPPLNLFGRDTVDGLAAALDRMEGLRALVVRAEGKVFTAGVDVHVFDGLSPSDADGFARELLELTHRFEALPFPTIASVHGLCLTAGFELSLACDLIWAARTAQFGLVERVVGVTPFMGGTQRVAERAGPARARELVMTGALYPAETLGEWNVLNRVVPDDELEEETMALAADLASGPTRAHSATKRIVRAQLDEGVRGADDATPALAAELFGTEDLEGAVRSFLEHGPGKATFSGR